ncbi:unnamed protein product [Cuscuta epithymum]|uniref:Biotin carboxyl carrier protein of acetyl-CoA carboxylase n=1 Tax=Cuscuta epithymum TaxID=186058 RepID=A0AAV0EAB8_9ASTE|nr:unnamed protein product [Cuscuta epithymum]
MSVNMASLAVSSAKTSALFGAASYQSRPQLPQHISSVCFLPGSRSLPRHQGVLKISAQLNEDGAVEKSGNSKVIVEEEVPQAEKKVSDASSISVLLSQAVNLVKLVDSKDIVEVKLKQMDCEILIRKKEAETLPETNIRAAPVSTGQPSFPQPIAQPLMAPASPSPSPSPPPSPAPSPAAAPALPPPAAAKPKLSGSQQKSPMAGTFYRAPSPGAPPYVKVGDTVKKGQILCIVEAMKLMNEIEAEISGTVVEIHIEDGKPVSVEMPLFTIAP